jgi:hypothetical protein
LKKKSSKTIIIFFITLGTSLGLYNSVLINDESSVGLDQTSFHKRLDEILGRTIEGRRPASEITILKNRAPMMGSQPVVVENKNGLEVEEIKMSPSIYSVPPNTGEGLSLKLFEIHIKQDPYEIQTENVSGHILVKNGVITNFSATFQDGETLNLENLELSASRFQYQYAGEVFDGIFYHSNENQYALNFTSGPFKNYQLIFKKE